MPDLAMCNNSTCELRTNCFRYRAKPDPHWQSYGYFESVNGECNNQIGIYLGDSRVFTVEEVDARNKKATKEASPNG